MNNTWKRKIELEDVEVFNELERKYNISFPDELKEFIIKYNRATPEKPRFMVGTTERVFGSVFSFNRSDRSITGITTIFPMLEMFEFESLTDKLQKNIPFPIDPFGNFIAYSVKDGTVVFWDHETYEITSTGKSLKDLIESLY